MQCLLRKSEINQLLEWLDGKVLQDQLHTVELVDRESIDASAFVNYMQTSRQKRRQVKDLAVLVNLVAANMDFNKVISRLVTTPALSNHYHYRDQEAAKQLSTLVNHSTENLQSSCPPFDSGEGQSG